MLSAVLVIAGLAIFFGLVLGFAAVRFKVDSDPVVDQIDAILPQTQCGQCGYPGCRPYAEAIANGEADINQCPPGGEDGMRALAELLDREPKPIGEEFGVEKPPMVAVIDEDTCIGCTLCIQACPVDAIVGAAKQMHTIIEKECTGCELCLPPCPVDCIDMVEIQPKVSDWKWPEPEKWYPPSSPLAEEIRDAVANAGSVQDNRNPDADHDIGHDIGHAAGEDSGEDHGQDTGNNPGEKAHG